MTTSARVRRWTVLAAAGALVATGCSSSDDDDSSPRSSGPDATAGATPSPGEPGSTEPAAGATPLSAPPSVVADTGEVADDYADSVGDVLADPPSDKEDEEDLTLDAVTGAALEDLRNQAAEYEASGWRVVGRPKVVRHKVTEYYDDPELAIVRACIDNSKVRVVDVDGRTVPGSRPARPRTLNILTLVKQEGEWVVTAQRPANRPDC